MRDLIDAYFLTLNTLASQVQASGSDGVLLPLETVVERFQGTARAACTAGCKLMFIGNGGSASIASHMAIDYAKNGGLRALAFNDGSALTCLGNDLGYDQVFAAQIEMHGNAGDVLIAISSSGHSPNILRAVKCARSKGCFVLTLSGFGADNPLRRMGDFNLYVPSTTYGLVEITHHALCHAILDLAMGWQGTSIIL